MSKKCTPLWREAHVEVQSAKKWGVRTTFGRSDVVSRGRRKGLPACQKWAKREGSVASQLQPPVHYTTLHSNYNNNYNYNYITLHYTHYTTLHYTTLHFASLH